MVYDFASKYSKLQKNFFFEVSGGALVFVILLTPPETAQPCSTTSPS
jgi:hypothetical protein